MKRKFIIAIAALTAVLFCGCESVGLNEQTSDAQDCNTVTQADQKEVKSDQVLNEDNSRFNDGVYRTYSLGTDFQKGTVLQLRSDLLLKVMPEPVKTVVYLDGGLYTTVEFSNEDEEIRLDESGNYWIAVVDDENNYYDITDEIDYLVESDGDALLYLL